MTSPDIDWDALRAAARAAMTHAYAPYSRFPVGVAGLVDGLGLCAECGMVSDLARSGGGRLVAVACVGGDGQPLMPCGRCRQLLWEHGGADMLRVIADRPIGPPQVDPPARAQHAARGLGFRKPLVDGAVASHLPRREIAQADAVAERRVPGDGSAEADFQIVGMRPEDEKVNGIHSSCDSTLRT